MEEVKEGKDYSFPAEELKILQLWDELDAFKEQLRRSEGRKPYVFYDGPPFATGLPHYGHLLAGTLKVLGDQLIRLLLQVPESICHTAITY
jgi:isoleucyl-tRNA synthetase